MKSPSFASSKVRLAQALGIGRSLLYEFFRLPDAPQPRANGMWHIPTWRKFIVRKREAVKGSEKESLQVLKLKIQCEREEWELARDRRELREKITSEFLTVFDRAHMTMASALRRMPDQLSGVFEGMSAREIHRVWKQRLNEVLSEAVRTVCQNEAREQPKQANIIAFERKKAAAGARNGAT